MGGYFGLNKCNETCHDCQYRPPTSQVDAKDGSKCRNPGCKNQKAHVHGVWKCSKRACEEHDNRSFQSNRSFPYTDGLKSNGNCKCNDTLYWHSKKCWDREDGMKCDDKCRCDCNSCVKLIREFGYRRLADAFPDCSVCEGSGKSRSWFLRQPCENCIGIGKVRD